MALTLTSMLVSKFVRRKLEPRHQSLFCNGTRLLDVFEKSLSAVGERGLDKKVIRSRARVYTS